MALFSTGIFETVTPQITAETLLSSISQSGYRTMDVSNPDETITQSGTQAYTHGNTLGLTDAGNATSVRSNTRVSEEDDSDDGISLSRWVLCSLLFVIILFTMLGNMIVLVAPFVERRLRNTLIYFIMNLALTDMLVAVMAMDFYTIDVLLGYWPFGEVMCGIWIFFDYGMTFASVFTLLAISLDRFWSVQWPIHYKIRNSKSKCIVMITAVWIVMLAMWLPPCIQDRLANSEQDVCIWEPSQNRDFVIVIAVLGHHGPCITIVICYVRVFLAMRKRLGRVGDAHARAAKNTRTPSSGQIAIKPDPSTIPEPPDQRKMSENEDSFEPESTRITSKYGNTLNVPRVTEEEQVNHQKRREERERRSFILLSYVIGSYLFCWVPFHVVFDVSAVDPDLVPDAVYRTTFWLTYFNSTLNPLLYAYSSTDFRNAFRKIIRCRFKRRY